MSTRTKEEIMREVASSKVNAIPVAASDTPKAFIETASHWLGRWWRFKSSWQQISPGYCALVCNPNFTAKPTLKDFALLRMFRDVPAKTLGGAIYVTDGVLGKVYRKQGQFDDANALIVELEAAGLADYPLVMFDPEAGIMVLAENGTRAPCVRMPPLGAFTAELTVPNVYKLLDGLYTTTLKYPTTFPQIWFNAKKHIPIFEAEKMFQGLALIHLRASAQDNWAVRPEEETNAGYPDLTISTQDPQCIFVLEIKVLKSFRYNSKGHSLTHSAAKNLKWAAEGIQQAADYRVALQASQAFLLLYDMRKKDADIRAITMRCAKEDILHRRYFIHNQSATEIRKSRKRR
jgi:uncharacterized protein (DUF2147 family)